MLTIDCTPHERILCYTHCSVSDWSMSLPSWKKPVSIYVKQHVHNKRDFLVDEAQFSELISAYARVCFNHGRETSVPTRNLAPRSREQNVGANVSASEVCIENETTVNDARDPKVNVNPVMKIQQMIHERITLNQKYLIL